MVDVTLIESLIETLKTPDALVQSEVIKALITLLRGAKGEWKATQQAIFDKGAIPLLVDIFLKVDDAKIVALSLLTALAAQNEVVISIIIENEAVMSVLFDSLSSLPLTSPLRSPMKEFLRVLGIPVPTAAQEVGEKMQEVPRWLDCLSAFVDPSAGKKAVLPEEVQESLKNLIYVLDKDLYAKEKIREAGGIPVLIGLVELVRTPIEIRARSLQLLGCLAQEHGENQQVIGQRVGAIPLLVGLLHPGKDLRERLFAAFVLGALVCLDPDPESKNKKLILSQEGVVRGLRELAAVEGSPSFRRMVFFALGPLGLLNAYETASGSGGGSLQISELDDLLQNFSKMQLSSSRGESSSVVTASASRGSSKSAAAFASASSSGPVKREREMAEIMLSMLSPDSDSDFNDKDESEDEAKPRKRRAGSGGVASVFGPGGSSAGAGSPGEAPFKAGDVVCPSGSNGS